MNLLKENNWQLIVPLKWVRLHFPERHFGDWRLGDEDWRSPFLIPIPSLWQD
ncbi:hypothetical protein H6F95_31720 [Cyanobacteria bacterium FACHB-471]|nr:hypothetical protein [Cyanobacteria bacterium FACHB-471]